MDCPTCHKPNCGNHAACARRALTKCPICKRNPCPDKVKCQKAFDGFELVSIIERTLQKTFPIEEMADWNERELVIARKSTLEVFIREIQRIEEKERMQTLGRLMLLGRF